MKEQKPTEQPATLKSKARGIFWGAAVGAMGVWMLVQPVSPLHPEEAHRAKVSLITTALDWIWGVPGGIVLLVLALVIAWSGFLPQSEDD